MLDPLVTVVTVVYNGASYVTKTIQSVLDQNLTGVEMIVIDGGSTDGTTDLLAGYGDRIRWISGKDEGIYDAMNKGLRMARGTWINFLNGGDWYYNDDTLRTVFDRPERDSLNLIYGDSINIYGQATRYIHPREISRKTLRVSMGLCHQAVFVRRSAAPEYDLRYRYKAEYNWIADIVFRIPPESVLHIPIPVVYYALGGFSERGMIANLKEYMHLTRTRFGVWQMMLNSPVYFIVFLRFLKYSLTRPRTS